MVHRFYYQDSTIKSETAAVSCSLDLIEKFQLGKQFKALCSSNAPELAATYDAVLKDIPGMSYGYYMQSWHRIAPFCLPEYLTRRKRLISMAQKPFTRTFLICFYSYLSHLFLMPFFCRQNRFKSR